MTDVGRLAPSSCRRRARRQANGRSWSQALAAGRSRYSMPRRLGCQGEDGTDMNRSFLELPEAAENLPPLSEAMRPSLHATSERS